MRTVLLVALLSAALLLSSVPSQAMQRGEPAGQPTDAQILHLLNRLSFGPAPGDIAAVRRLGIDGYINQQLHPEAITLPSELTDKLDTLPTLKETVAEIDAQYALPPGTNRMEMSADDKREYEKRTRIAGEELKEAKIFRAILSPAQLQEVMVDFWFNHFNVFALKGEDKFFIGPYERDAIRPYTMGKFRDLLYATASHPAMLFYLDNAHNIDPNSVLAERAEARGKQLGINENYAREVMELHTLGVDGGYSQQDVTTLAHILTGFGLQGGKDPGQRANFAFDPKRHDFGDKILLGQRVKGGGLSEISGVMDMLAAHPATARHISYQLAQYFVTDQPPAALVDRLTETFTSSGGDIGVVLNALFHAPEFWDPKYTQNKFKPPFRFVVSAMRAANVVPPGDTRFIQGTLREMGEPLYDCLTPNGYSMTNDQWLNSDALLKRIDFGKQLSKFLGADAAGTIAASLGDNNWSQNTLTAVRNATPDLQSALLMGSPEFVYY